MLFSSDEGKNKSSKPNHTKNIGLVTPKETFFCHAQVIMTSRDWGRNMGLEISRFFTDYDCNIIGPHSNALVPDEVRN